MSSAAQERSHLRAFNVSIQRDEQGRHIVRYPKLKEELTLPTDYPDQLVWIRQSCERFLQKVRDKEELVKALSSS